MDGTGLLEAFVTLTHTHTHTHTHIHKSQTPQHTSSLVCSLQVLVDGVVFLEAVIILVTLVLPFRCLWMVLCSWLCFP